MFRNQFLGRNQIRSRADFEEDILKAKLNGEVLGDMNYSTRFDKQLDYAIYR